VKKLFLLCLFFFCIIRSQTNEDILQDLSYALVYVYPLDFNNPATKNAFLHHTKGLYNDAYQSFSRLINNGTNDHVKAMASYMIGLMQLMGQGVSRNYAAAQESFEKAASLGSQNEKRLAEFFLAVMPQWKWQFGLLKKPFPSVLDEFDKEIDAEQDKGKKAFLLYQKGLLMIPYLDVVSAFDIFKQSLALFDELTPPEKKQYESEINLMNVTLGEAYYQGYDDIKKDLQKAARYYEKAAEEETNVYIRLGAFLRLLQLKYNDIEVKLPSKIGLVDLLRALSQQIYNPVVQRMAVNFLGTVLGGNTKKALSAFLS